MTMPAALAEQHERWKQAHARLWHPKATNLAPPSPESGATHDEAIDPIREVATAARQKTGKRRNQVEALRARMATMEDDLRRLRIELRMHVNAEVEAKTDAETSWPKPKHWKLIVAEVADAHGVRMTDMLSTRRKAVLVRARWEAMWRLRNETTMSLPLIGRRMGHRDHTTVLYGIRQHERLLGQTSEEGTGL